jgi:septum site-determining protein MinD
MSSNQGHIALNGKSKAGEAFRNIARRLDGDEVPFLPMEDNDGIFKRVARLFRSGGN